MMFQNTRKYYLSRYANQVTTNSLEQLKGLPFYDWSDADKMQLSCILSTNTTFNHAIGLPEKNGLAFPLFDYEQMLFNELQNHKHLWIKKATGLGVTEFMLRYMTWLCFNSKSISNGQMCNVTGPRIELAITNRGKRYLALFA